MTAYKLLLPEEYKDQLVVSINAAKHRVNMIALVINEDAATLPVIEALERASLRGVHVDVAMDLFFTYKELGKTSRWSYLRSKIQHMRATKERLEVAGVKVRWLGQFGATLFSRRTHVKWSIVDDTVYSFGGVNLYDGGLLSNDYMFRIDDARLAERMVAEHELIISTDRAGRGYPSHTFGVARGAVLVDGGRMLDSVIYRRACRLAEQAERVVYVSQYCPTGRLGKILKRQNAELYFNRSQNAADKLSKVLISTSTFFHGLSTQYKHTQYLHAKFMLFYMLDGSVESLSGSHNFVASGGALGTREVALESSDPSVVGQLEDFLDSYVR